MTDATTRLKEARDAYARGDLGMAADRYRSLLQQDTQFHDEAYQILGILAYRAGKIDLALQLTQAALSLSPNMAEALINQAIYLRILHRTPEARVSARKAVESNPLMSGAWHTSAFLALDARDYDEAIQHAAEAVRLDPNNALALANYASALMVKSDLARAYETASKALALMPNEALMSLTIGQVLRAAGYPLRALPHFRKAYELKPDYVDARTAEAAALSVLDVWEESWAAWESRYYDAPRFAKLLRWNGDRISYLILHAEQGMGDALQFLRFAPLIEKRVDRVILQVPQPIQKLVAATFPHLEVITPQDRLPDVDAHCPLMSAPYILKTTKAELPPPLALALSMDLRDKARAFLNETKGPHVCLVWAGNPEHSNDHNRSVPFESIKPFIKEFAPYLLSLQEGKIQRFDAEGSFKETTALASNDPISDSAALMAEADLVISIDSMPAHLAGCLGQPVWLLTPFDPDGRWLLGCEDSVWYPSLRLFRQAKPKDWTNVVQDISVAMRRLIAGDKTVLAPTPSKGEPFTQHPQAIDLPI